ncbi:MAG: hypothetical protein OXR07_08740 [Nitrospira sp.]|nr:hypothetical protein [Nitrospira sp.]MDD9860209.1 hypothetical protein [Nitrospira sp.]
MWRIIIILILLIILFLMIRKSFRDFRSRKSTDQALPSKDTMVQDPVCKVYIAACSAVVEKIGGQRYHFCSAECACKFKNYMTGRG